MFFHLTTLRISKYSFPITIWNNNNNKQLLFSKKTWNKSARKELKGSKRESKYRYVFMDLEGRERTLLQQIAYYLKYLMHIEDQYS